MTRPPRPLAGFRSFPVHAAGTGARLLSLLLVTSHAVAAPDPAIPVAPAPSATAPGIEAVLARRTAEEELRTLVAHEAPSARMPGVYVAFDTQSVTPYALAACDEDGDYVVVVSDPMLVVLDFVADATAADDLLGTHKTDDYAAMLAPRERATTRLFAPPPGFFATVEASEAGVIDAAHDARFVEMVDFVLAAELAHAGTDLTCPTPTVTREAGDSVWTRDERARALATASRLATPSAVRAADARANAWLESAGIGTRGRDAWLSFVAKAGTEGALGFYARLHPRAPG